MQVRDFLVAVPGLCGAKNADRIADIFAYVYDCEAAGGTPFDRNDEDRLEHDNRSSFLWDMLYCDSKASPENVTYCRTLAEIIERTHYLDEHGEKFQSAIIERLYNEAKDKEKDFPEVSEYMTAEDAVTSRWSD